MPLFSTDNYFQQNLKQIVKDTVLKRYYGSLIPRHGVSLLFASLTACFVGEAFNFLLPSAYFDSLSQLNVIDNAANLSRYVLKKMIVAQCLNMFIYANLICYGAFHFAFSPIKRKVDHWVTQVNQEPIVALHRSQRYQIKRISRTTQIVILFWLSMGVYAAYKLLLTNEASEITRDHSFNKIDDVTDSIRMMKSPHYYAIYSQVEAVNRAYGELVSLFLQYGKTALDTVVNCPEYYDKITLETCTSRVLLSLKPIASMIQERLIVISAHYPDYAMDDTNVMQELTDFVDSRKHAYRFANFLNLQLNFLASTIQTALFIGYLFIKQNIFEKIKTRLTKRRMKNLVTCIKEANGETTCQFEHIGKEAVLLDYGQKTAPGVKLAYLATKLGVVIDKRNDSQLIIRTAGHLPIWWVAKDVQCALSKFYVRYDELEALRIRLKREFNKLSRDVQWVGYLSTRNEQPILVATLFISFSLDDNYNDPQFLDQTNANF